MNICLSRYCRPVHLSVVYVECITGWQIGFYTIIFLCGVLFIPGHSQCCNGYSVMDELVAMEAKIFKNDIFSLETCREV